MNYKINFIYVQIFVRINQKSSQLMFIKYILKIPQYNFYSILAKLQLSLCQIFGNDHMNHHHYVKRRNKYFCLVSYHFYSNMKSYNNQHLSKINQKCIMSIQYRIIQIIRHKQIPMYLWQTC
ncbi:unnamed protein product [Paramecium primaurelia]|uniref:Uncharacterized protein n=1 Tax=Paramecium primaurelia TaxID=5886 RepID=A0A8S1NZ13_PARPR|nr:unnamed protein product [Paramecium primaurelia]